MILQALKEYYDRKAADPENGIAPEGFERKEIPFLVVIKPNGEFINLEDTRDHMGNRLVGQNFLLPRSQTRTGSRSYETTFLLWDHIGYLFGHPGNLKAQRQHQTWISFLETLPDDLKKDEGVSAIIAFYKSNGIERVKAHQNWAECIKLPSCNMTFKLIGDNLPIPCRPIVQKYIRASVTQDAESAPEGQGREKVVARCLVTGECGEIARTHGRTPINKDTKSLVAFQKNSGYDSYGKEQCYNAPVCKSAEFAYTTGLNALLKSRMQRIQVGDAATVFWSARDSSFENDAFFFFSEPPKNDPDRNTEAVRAVYNSIWNGAYIVPDDDTRFYVLGLAPNSARISVRFWHVGTVKEMAMRFKQHVDDLTIVHSDKMDAALPMRRLLRSIAVLEKEEKIPPNLSGDIMRAILEGAPYPATLLSSAVRRARAEQSKKNKQTGKSEPNVPYERAALIKACLNRSIRINNPKQEEVIKVSLDPNNTNIGYRLGRLFAALEKIQQESSPGINATIRDKFYGAASSTPITVFGNLMRLKNHHLAKLESAGRRVQFEKLLSEIMGEITDFPAYLPLEDQGRFAIGYYHQMQDFFTRKADNKQPIGDRT